MCAMQANIWSMFFLFKLMSQRTEEGRIEIQAWLAKTIKRKQGQITVLEVEDSGE